MNKPGDCRRSRISARAVRTGRRFKAMRGAMLCAMTLSLSVVVGADDKSAELTGAEPQIQSRNERLADGSAAALELISLRVEPSVFQEIQASANGTAYVMVMLRPVAQVAAANEAQRLASIKTKQDVVLGKLAGKEFTLRYQYKNFSGFTGVVNATGLNKLGVDPDVLSIGSDAPVHAVLSTSVPFINADQVHAQGITGQGVTVAVIDTGIDTNHPDMIDNVAAGAFTFLNGGATQIPGGEDDNGHGTNVAGIITSAGVVAPLGVAPDADILSIKVLDSAGNGFVSDWVAGIDYVVSIRHTFNKLCAINMSLSTNLLFSICPCDNDQTFNQTSQAAILAAKNAGIVTFVASGNDFSCGSMGSPACLSSTVAVAAVEESNNGVADRVTTFSNQSGCNDLAAPGNGITAPGIGGGTSTFFGTSQAAPHVAAVAALMCSKCKDIGILSPDTIVSTMKATGVATTDSCSVNPQPIRVDALAAVLAVNDMCKGEDVKFSQSPFSCECKADIDKNGIVEIVDVIAVTECVGGDCSNCVPNSCDVDCDGDVDQDDADAAACVFAGTPNCCPTFEGEDIESNIDWVDMQPNVVIADDFTSDGRPITGVRWWGSVLKEPDVIKPGIDVAQGLDLWHTPQGGSQQDFTGTPIPADFFDPGSDPFTSIATFEGVPLPSSPSLGATDTIVQRLADAPMPDCPDTSVIVPIEIIALSLRSSQPITVTYNGGQNPESWDIRVFLANGPQQQGTMTIQQQCSEGGTFDSTLNVDWKAEFTRQGDGAVRVYDTIANGVGPTVFTASGTWVYSPDPIFVPTFAFPGTQVDTDGDGVFDTILGIGSSNFFAGYEQKDCFSCNVPSTGQNKPPLTQEQAMWAAHGVNPPNQEDLCCIPGEACFSANPKECALFGGILVGDCADCPGTTRAADDMRIIRPVDQDPWNNIGASDDAESSAAGVPVLNWDGWFISFHLPQEPIKLPDAYILDDGSHENSIGVGAPFDILWINQFNVAPGLEVINSIRVAWGVVANGTPAQVLLYDDPNNDGDPSDAVLLTTTATAVADADTNILTTVDIPDTFVGSAGDSFFIGAVLTNADLEFPASQDTSPSQGRSWIAGSAPGTIDIFNLPNNDLPVALVDLVGDPPGSLAGNWLVRGGSLTIQVGQSEPLALYYCDAVVVDITPTALPDCDGHPVEEYRTNLAQCCLIHANVDPRSGTIPAVKDAFYEDKCSEYLIDIQAVVGHTFFQDPVTLDCIEVDTGKTLDGPFWGWHTAPFDHGDEHAVETFVKMGLDESWLYGPWLPFLPVCSQPNMAFELLTQISSNDPDCNQNWVPDQCEPDCQPNGIPDDCDIANGTSPDNNGNGVPDECECCVSSTPLDVQIPDSVGGNPLRRLTTNRTLIINLEADNCPSGQAIRVTLSNLAAPHDIWNGDQLWLTEPKLVSENGSTVAPIPGFSNNYWSSLECTATPHCRADWASLGDIHIFHEGIRPDSEYEIEIVDCTCTDQPNAYSPALSLETARFGDVVRDCAKIPCPPPEGAINIIDIQVILQAFSSAAGAPRKARAEMDPNCPDLKINITDAVQAINAFSGLPYSFPPKDPLSDACGSPCVSPLGALP